MIFSTKKKSWSVSKCLDKKLALSEKKKGYFYLLNDLMAW